MVKLLNAHKHRHREQATRGCLRLEPTGTQSGSGALTSPDANLKTAGVQSEPKSIPCRMQNMETLATWATLLVAIPTARQEQLARHGEDRRSQCQRVMRRICHVGLVLNGKRVCGTASNREMQMTSDVRRLVRLGAIA